MSVVSDVQAIFKPPNAMRGGIQMCFPQVLQHDPFFSRFLLDRTFLLYFVFLSAVYKFMYKLTDCEGLAVKFLWGF
jgi:hypothetical protein